MSDFADQHPRWMQLFHLDAAKQHLRQAIENIDEAEKLTRMLEEKKHEPPKTPKEPPAPGTS